MPLFAKDDKVDYLTDNGYGNAVGPPAGVHHNGVTYVAYQGPDEDAWVASYNHETGEWVGPLLAGESAMEQRGNIDNHGKPAMVIDDEGYIHIFYGGHGGTAALGENKLGNYNNGEQRHVVSTKPFDITSWEMRKNISPFGTYSQVIKMDNGDIYLFFRHGAHRSNWVYQRSTDNGRTFEDVVSIALSKRRTDISAVDSWYLKFLKAPGDKIAARVYYHICNDPPHVGERQNGYYMVMSAEDQLWRNIHGDVLEMPLTKEHADQYALAVNTGEKWVHGGDLALDDKGYPHFLLYLGDQNGKPWGGPKLLHHCRWNGEEWLFHGGDEKTLSKRGNLHVPSPENVNVLVTEGTKLRWWNSKDGGKTLNPGKTYFEVEDGTLMISDFIENAHPDARLLVARKVDNSDFRRVYLVGDNGAIQRSRFEAEILTEAQKALPPVKND
ncbi:BNR-4 repeat-containing protein [Pelagicoccus enzymogenes]|uniref:BNR-4 repeat-containing protein n=1 Tax=Pelagicoccus enzymogenes TaxID=2773457 RepID=UPI00280D9FA1|nr:BNR-4 repeat-containing protein [Pelagicoccus enzymogenes]MDQ8198630.1 BNR-4 repeat-containing protein [Pelagicoccus enzymogenes]